MKVVGFECFVITHHLSPAIMERERRTTRGATPTIEIRTEEPTIAAPAH